MPSPSSHAYKFKMTLITLLAITLTPLACQAEVYKWTDNNGNTHYSDLKPNEISSEKLNIKTNKPNETRTSPQNASQMLDEKKSKELQAQAKRLSSETQEKELNTQCENIRNNLKTLQENSRIKVNENGKIRYLNPTEIEDKKQNYIQQLNDQCSK